MKQWFIHLKGCLHQTKSEYHTWQIMPTKQHYQQTAETGHLSGRNDVHPVTKTIHNTALSGVEADPG